MRGGDQAFTAFVDARSASLLRFAYLLAPDAYVRRVLVTVAADERRRPWRREVATAKPPEQASSRDPTSGVDETDLLRRTLAGI